MTLKTKFQQLMVIDRHDYWRALAVRALTAAGYSVCAFDSYAYPPPGAVTADEIPDLVILGCVTLGPEEKELIDRIIDQGQHVLVFATSIPWRKMRSLFLAGVDDVTEKPYDPERLVGVVRQTLENIALRDNQRVVETL
jgi:response regulator RpfG family c-di-GMP phosphodiesterase